MNLVSWLAKPPIYMAMLENIVSSDLSPIPDDDIWTEVGSCIAGDAYPIKAPGFAPFVVYMIYSVLVCYPDFSIHCRYLSMDNLPSH